MIYEKGFKDAINLCLDIERQWSCIQGVLSQEVDENRAISLLSSVLRLMETLSRSDAKVLLIQELNQISEKALNLSDNVDGVVTASSIKIKSEEVAKKLAMGPRILAATLISDPFLSKCYYKQVDIYNSPICDTWKKQTSQEILLQAQYWLHALEVVYQACELVLWVIRASADFKPTNASQGFYREQEMQDILKLSLVRIRYDNPRIYPNVSVAHRWLVITFFEGCWQDGAYQHIQLKEDISCELSLCL